MKCPGAIVGVIAALALGAPSGAVAEPRLGEAIIDTLRGEWVPLDQQPCAYTEYRERRRELETVSESELLYDDGGRIWDVLSRVYYRPGRGDDFQVEKHTSYTYDDAGRVVQRRSSSSSTGSDPSRSSVIRYTYDEAGEVTRMHSNNKLLRYENSYDEAGRLITSTRFDEDGTVTSSRSWIYDKRGRPERLETDEGADGRLDAVKTFGYDTQGRLNRTHRETTRDYEGCGGVVDRYYRYDARGRLSWEARLNLTCEGVDSWTSIWVYQWDEDDRLLSQTELLYGYEELWMDEGAPQSLRGFRADIAQTVDWLACERRADKAGERDAACGEPSHLGVSELLEHHYDASGLLVRTEACSGAFWINGCHTIHYQHVCPVIPPADFIVD